MSISHLLKEAWIKLLFLNISCSRGWSCWLICHFSLLSWDLLMCYFWLWHVNMLYNFTQRFLSYFKRVSLTIFDSILRILYMHQCMFQFFPHIFFVLVVSDLCRCAGSRITLISFQTWIAKWIWSHWPLTQQSLYNYGTKPIWFPRFLSFNC